MSARGRGAVSASVIPSPHNVPRSTGTGKNMTLARMTVECLVVVYVRLLGVCSFGVVAPVDYRITAFLFC